VTTALALVGRGDKWDEPARGFAGPPRVGARAVLSRQRSVPTGLMQVGLQGCWDCQWGWQGRARQEVVCAAHISVSV
jgi:hypothetical protein